MKYGITSILEGMFLVKEPRLRPVGEEVLLYHASALPLFHARAFLQVLRPLNSARTSETSWVIDNSMTPNRPFLEVLNKGMVEVYTCFYLLSVNLVA